MCNRRWFIMVMIDFEYLFVKEWIAANSLVNFYIVNKSARVALRVVINRLSYIYSSDVLSIMLPFSVSHTSSILGSLSNFFISCSYKPASASLSTATSKQKYSIASSATKRIYLLICVCSDKERIYERCYWSAIWISDLLTAATMAALVLPVEEARPLIRAFFPLIYSSSRPIWSFIIINAKFKILL
jgi:hypothetical protein